MKTKTITLYSFNELTKDGQNKALSNLYDINTYNGWDDFIFEDAKTVGLEIKEYEFLHGSATDIVIDFIGEADNTARLIIENHGPGTETFKAAKAFLDSKMGELQQWKFIDRLAVLYLEMFKSNYDHYTSDEAIIETIEANEYYFDEKGNIQTPDETEALTRSEVEQLHITLSMLSSGANVSRAGLEGAEATLLKLKAMVKPEPTTQEFKPDTTGAPTMGKSF